MCDSVIRRKRYNGEWRTIRRSKEGVVDKRNGFYFVPILSFPKLKPDEYVEFKYASVVRYRVRKYVVI